MLRSSKSDLLRRLGYTILHYVGLLIMMLLHLTSTANLAFLSQVLMELQQYQVQESLSLGTRELVSLAVDVVAAGILPSDIL
jgi:hypothetical protein